jgi:hypothetical protein
MAARYDANSRALRARTCALLDVPYPDTILDTERIKSQRLLAAKLENCEGGAFMSPSRNT